MSDDADWWRYYWAGWDTWNGETPDDEPVDLELSGEAAAQLGPRT